MRRLVALSGILMLQACGLGHAQLAKNKTGGGGGSSATPLATPLPPGPGTPPPTPSPTPTPVEAGPKGKTSYMPVDQSEAFADMRTRLVGEKAAVEARQQDLLHARYDLSDRPAITTMSRGKPLQQGVRVKLPAGVSWQDLAALPPGVIRDKGLFPGGFLPLPHPKQSEGGQVFPQVQIDEIKKQEGRDLTRFDIDFDIPQQFLAEFPPAIFLSSRIDLGDVSQGQLITNKNFYDLFIGILTPKQLDGLRLLVTPFAQQQFNLTDDRRVDTPQLGVTCFDCHANGHTNGAVHLDPQTRPQEMRRRVTTPSLRGVNIQRLFGSQRALKTVEDFTQFEQIGAYFDGDPLTAFKKGMNILNRDTQVNDMAEFQELLTFPPAPKLDDVEGKLRSDLATQQELSGQDLFFNKAKCATCHTPPYYTDNSMHDLQVERFYKAVSVNGRFATAEGPIKTFPLRGIKDQPPYLHDGRLLTLEDTVEFFNLVDGTKLTEQEKADLVAFLRVL